MPNLPRRSLRKNRPSCRRVPAIAFQKGGTLGSARVAGNGQGYFWGNNRYQVACVWLPSCERSDRNGSDRRPGDLLRRRLGRDPSHDPMQTFGQIRYLLRLQVPIRRLPSQKKSFNMAGDRLHVAFPAGFNRIQDFA